jgi:hypothetical protein
VYLHGYLSPEASKQASKIDVPRLAKKTPPHVHATYTERDPIGSGKLHLLDISCPFALLRAKRDYIQPFARISAKLRRVIYLI